MVSLDLSVKISCLKATFFYTRRPRWRIRQRRSRLWKSIFNVVFAESWIEIFLFSLNYAFWLLSLSACEHPDWILVKNIIFVLFASPTLSNLPLFKSKLNFISVVEILLLSEWCRWNILCLRTILFSVFYLCRSKLTSISIYHLYFVELTCRYSLSSSWRNITRDTTLVLATFSNILRRRYSFC